MNGKWFLIIKNIGVLTPIKIIALSWRSIKK
jgi:hypothetical protein